MVFYLLRWTYFSDANAGKNILMNSQLKRILLKSSNKTKWNTTEKNRINMEKENNTDQSDFHENDIPNLISLKPFEFESKTNIRDIKSSQKQPSLQLYLKRDSGTGVFQWILQNF